MFCVLFCFDSYRKLPEHVADGANPLRDWLIVESVAVMLAGFLAEFVYERWLHSSHPFFQLAINLSSALFLLLYGIIGRLFPLISIWEMVGEQETAPAEAAVQARRLMFPQPAFEGPRAVASGEE